MSIRFLTATLAALAAGLGGCGTPPPRSAAHPVAAVAMEARQASVPERESATSPPVLADGADIPLADLVDLARRTTPTRELFAANRAAAAAAVSQAGAWANPEVEVGIGRARAREADETGTRPATGIGGIRISQRFELPGKRSSRIMAAEAGRTSTERSAAVDALELELEVRGAAVAVALADLQAAQAAQAETLASQVHAAVESRHRAGESDQGDLARATAELATARLAREASSRDGEAARAALRTWCGDGLPARFTVADALPEIPAELPLAKAQMQARATHPRLALLAARSGAAAAAVAREERAWYPDLTLGVSGSRETDTNDLGVSLGMEIPLWNRNGGGIAQAEAELAHVAAERRQEAALLERQVLAAWNTYDRERHQVAGLAGDLLPAFREALRVKLAAFTAGDAVLFDLIDAKRSLMEAEQALLDARARAALARIELARAVGTTTALQRPASSMPSADGRPTSPTIPLPTGATP